MNLSQNGQSAFGLLLVVCGYVGIDGEPIIPTACIYRQFVLSLKQTGPAQSI